MIYIPVYLFISAEMYTSVYPVHFDGNDKYTESVYLVYRMYFIAFGAVKSVIMIYLTLQVQHIPLLILRYVILILYKRGLPVDMTASAT